MKQRRQLAALTLSAAMLISMTAVDKELSPQPVVSRLPPLSPAPLSQAAHQCPLPQKGNPIIR